MDFLYSGFCLFPVAAELVQVETVRRRYKRPTRQRGKPCNAHIDADGATVGYGLFNFTLRLYTHEPFFN
jgi:hypothetical protein